MHGPEGCRIAGHLTVRKVPGTLKLVLHSSEHDHEDHLVNSTHGVAEFWFGEPLSRLQQSRPGGMVKSAWAWPPAVLQRRTTCLLWGLPFGPGRREERGERREERGERREKRGQRREERREKREERRYKRDERRDKREEMREERREKI